MLNKIALFLFASTLHAQGWVDVTPATPGPASGYDGAMCYDPVRGVSWLFRPNGNALEAWSWNGTAWTMASTTPNLAFGPTSSCAAWDPINQRVVIGLISGGPLAEFWTWDGAAWSQPSALSPPVGIPSWLALTLQGARLGFDDAHGDLVLVAYTGSPPVSVVYTWNGTLWVLRSPSVNIYYLNVANGSLFYDATRSRLALAGAQVQVSAAPQYWEWSGSNWIQRYPNPSYASLGQVAPAPQLGVSLCQRFTTTPTSPQPATLSLAQGAFTQIYLSDWPAARLSHHLVYDSLRDRFVLHGGVGPFGAGVFADTWELQLGPTASYTLFGAGCTGVNGTPLLHTQGNGPSVGTTFALQVDHLPFSGPALMFLGFSKTTWNGIQLPLNLGFLGAPACNMNISGDILYGMPNVLGVGLWTLQIPNIPGLAFYNQAVAFDAAANPLGLSFSNAGSGVIGN